MALKMLSTALVFLNTAVLDRALKMKFNKGSSRYLQTTIPKFESCFESVFLLFEINTQI